MIRPTLAFFVLACEPPPPPPPTLPPDIADVGAMTCIDQCRTDGVHLDRECYDECNKRLDRWQRWRDRNLPKWRELSEEELAHIRTAYMGGFAEGTMEPRPEPEKKRRRKKR